MNERLIRRRSTRPITHAGSGVDSRGCCCAPGDWTGPEPATARRHRRVTYSPPMRYVESVLDLVGNTPLVRIQRITSDLGLPERQPLLLAKVTLLQTPIEPIGRVWVWPG